MQTSKLARDKGSMWQMQVNSALDRYIFTEEPNAANVRAPVYICGDVLGQFYDLM